MSTNSTDGNVKSINHGEYDILIIKFDISGKIIWEKSYGGSRSDHPYLCYSTQNGYIIGGNTDSNDGDVRSGNHGERDCWLFEINNDGTLIWEQTFGGSSNDQLVSFIPTPDGYIFGARTLSKDGDVKSSKLIGDTGLENSGLMNFWLVKTGKGSKPTDIILLNDNVDENKPDSTMVGLITSVDEDKNDTYNYQLISEEGDTDNTRFYISNDTLFTKELFDYELKSSYSILIQTKDIEENIFSKSIPVSINNLNELYISDTRITKPKCLKYSSGSIEYKVNEFVPPLSFLWSNGQTTQNLNNINYGSYTITITDGDGMNLVHNFTIDTIPIIYGNQYLLHYK